MDTSESTRPACTPRIQTTRDSQSRLLWRNSTPFVWRCHAVAILRIAVFGQETKPLVRTLKIMAPRRRDPTRKVRETASFRSCDATCNVCRVVQISFPSSEGTVGTCLEPNDSYCMTRAILAFWIAGGGSSNTFPSGHLHYLRPLRPNDEPKIQCYKRISSSQQ
jgi:hypothetical protein